MSKNNGFRWVMNSAVFRMIALAIILIVPIDLLTLIMSNEAIEQVENQISNDTENALSLYMNQIDFILAGMNYREYYFSTQDEDYIRLNTKIPDTITERQAEFQSLVNLINKMKDMEQEYSWNEIMFAYFPKKDYFLAPTTGNVEIEKDIIRGLIDQNKEDNLGQWTVQEGSGKKLLLRIVQYRNSYYGAWINLEELMKDMDYEVTDSILLFAKNDGSVICGGDYDFSGYNLLESGNVITYQGEKYITLHSESSMGDLMMIELLSRNELTESFPGYIRILRYVAFLALALIPFLFLGLHRFFVQPIRSLLSAMAEIESGNIEFRINSTTNSNEFKSINRNFNAMMDQVQQLKIDVYEKELEKQNIKMRYLSQQIQPHFILNAMNIIYSYEPEDYPLIQKMVLCLSKYFRYIVNANETFVMLKHEFAHIENYFEIQKARYPQAFLYQISYEEELGECCLPPLIVQNFAENVIKHSIKLGEVIEVHLTAARLEDGKVSIILEDTGAGIEDRLLKKIKKFRETRKPQKGLGIGIQNTIERIDILYDSRATLDIRRGNDDIGTVVEIIIPYYLMKEVEINDDDSNYS